MGWRFNWVSSFGSDFNFDYQVSFTPEEKASGKAVLQLRHDRIPQRRNCRASACSTRMPTGEVFHTYSSYGRGLDILIGAYNFLDMTPKGRDEEGLQVQHGLGSPPRQV